MTETNFRCRETRAKLIEALIAVQGEASHVQKSGKNPTQGYRYAGLLDYQDALGDSLKAHGIATIETVHDVTDLEPIPTRSGGQLRVSRVELELEMLHSEGASLSVRSYGVGMDSGDKQVAKAITGARKYAWAQAFALVTTDDAEAHTRGEDAVYTDSENPAPEGWRAGKPAQAPPQAPPAPTDTPAADQLHAMTAKEIAATPSPLQQIHEQRGGDPISAARLRRLYAIGKTALGGSDLARGLTRIVELWGYDGEALVGEDQGGHPDRWIGWRDYDFICHFLEFGDDANQSRARREQEKAARNGGSGAPMRSTATPPEDGFAPPAEDIPF